MKRLLLPVLALLCLALTVALLLNHVAKTNLEQENAFLRSQVQSFTESRDELTRSSVVRVAEPVPETAAAELARLRGENSTLKRDQQQLEKLRAENQTLRTQAESARAAAATAKPDLANIQVPKTLPRESWAFRGYADPESAMQSVLFAGASGDPAAILAGFTPEQIAQMRTEDNGNKTEAEVAQRIAQQISKIKRFDILQNERISENETVLTLFIDGMEGSEQTPRMKMQKVGNEWRLAGPHRPDKPNQ